MVDSGGFHRNPIIHRIPTDSYGLHLEKFIPSDSIGFLLDKKIPPDSVRMCMEL